MSAYYIVAVGLLGEYDCKATPGRVPLGRLITHGASAVVLVAVGTDTGFGGCDGES